MRLSSSPAHIKSGRDGRQAGCLDSTRAKCCPNIQISSSSQVDQTLWQPHGGG